MMKAETFDGSALDIEFDEDSYEELDEDESTETNGVSDTLYIPLGNPKSIKVIPQALTVPDELHPVTVEGFTLAWTKDALLSLAEIKPKEKTKNLPYASLRGLLEVGLDNAARIQSDLALSRSSYQAKNNNEIEPFAYLNEGSIETIRDVLKTSLNDWIANYLRPFAKREEAPQGAIERLLELQEEDKLMEITPLDFQILPWKWSKETGTTKRSHPKGYDYRVLIDYVARAIAGQEIFQGLGPMKRVISSGGSFTTGVSELITNPITLEKKSGQFSLLLRLELVTIPSLHQPLLKIDVTKRRWVSGRLIKARYNSGKISGFVFSRDDSDRVFQYKVIPQKETSNGKANWQWAIDKDFEPLRRQLDLRMKGSDGQNIDGQAIALGNASTESCQVLLTYRNGLQEDNHDLDVGVPEIDKLEAFEKVAKILEPIGFKPFDDYEQVKFEKGESHQLDDTASRMINLPTLLSAVLETLETGNNLEFAPNYLTNLSETELNSLLDKHLGLNLETISRGRKSLQFTKKVPEQTQELEALIQKNKEAIERFYPNKKPLLVFFYEKQLQTEVKFLKEIIPFLWGGAIELMVNHLPDETHGPRDVLPGSDLKNKKRLERRIEKWEPIAQQLSNLNREIFCLVMARQFYPDPNTENKFKHDDRINKPATCQALAGIADCRVQFLLPIDRTKKEKRLELDDFFLRLQAALKDLLSAHSGRIDGVKEKVDKWFPEEENKPKEIIGITIVRKQKGRLRGFIESTFLPVAMRLKVETGECELSYPYEEGNKLEISSWRKFSEAVTAIAQISPVKLADKEEDRKIRFRKFVKTIISESVEEKNQPLVMIDSSNCVQLWPWLADTRINANQINLGQQYEHMQQEWEGARIIRIRQELAPGIIDKKVRKFAETWLEDTRTEKELKELSCSCLYKIPSASSSMKLFRLTTTNKTDCIAYWSVGRKAVHQQSRGQSCYHGIEKAIPKKNDDSKSKALEVGKKNDNSKDHVKNSAGLKVYQIETIPPYSEQWPTPNPLEIVVTLRQPEDDPDSLAALVESLRYSFGHYRDWTSLPAPLFFERVIRDYISDFTLEDDDSEAEPN